jgi:osmotically inducible protein OsmC
VDVPYQSGAEPREEEVAMATERKARTVWQGGLADGTGEVSLESSGIMRGIEVSWPSRAEEPQGRTSPEELIAAAHSSCFSMALSGGLAKQGHPPERLDVTATVGFQGGVGITGIHLDVEGTVAGFSNEEFVAAAEEAKRGCPVSKALAVEISLTAHLAGNPN